MKTAYEPANTVEAHMIQDYLRQEGIPAEVHGASLTSAVGELPASGLVRVVVDDEHYERARAAIRRWEASEEPAAPAAQADARAPRSRFWIGLAGLIAGVAIGHAFHRAPLRHGGIDHNADGRQDEFWKQTLSGTVREVEIDRNFDDRIDSIIHYDETGEVTSSQEDDDFDGKFETQYRYSLGRVKTAEVDNDGDGIVNLRSTYEDGVLRTVEYIDPYSGRAVRVEHFKVSTMTHADLDTDGDGALDTRQIVSPEQTVTRTEALR